MADRAAGPPPPPERPYASRAGAKLEHALRAFGIDPAGAHCADLGCSAGGFVDCWLRFGAASVVAVDTGYGVLDYRLREDTRVHVMERTNALHAEPPEHLARLGGAHFVSIDMSWTPQALALPAALRWLSGDESARIVTLVKPHYEATSTGYRDRFASLVRRGALPPDDAERVLEAVLADLPSLGVGTLGVERSPITGRKSGKRRSSGGSAANSEYLVLLAREAGATGGARNPDPAGPGRPG